jgi:hypothetical protein
VTDPSTSLGPPPEDRVGQVGGIVKLVSSLTFTQVLVIALLVMIAIPTYIIWRMVNDESMLNKFTSRYEEITTQQMPCTLRVASVRGGGDTYSISTGFAYQGQDRWNVAVIMQRKPESAEMIAYCETLQLLVDHLRRPEAPEPTFPNSDEPMIWHYPAPEQP